MSDILAAIDAATEQRCACGCDRLLDPDGPSGWFVTQDCQRKWADRNATDPQEVYARPDVGLAGLIAASSIGAAYEAPHIIVSPAVYERLAAAYRLLGLGVQQFVAECAPIISQLDDLREVVADSTDREPTDPMERALWLRKHRNTGPKPNQRAPRTLGVGQR